MSTNQRAGFTSRDPGPQVRERGSASREKEHTHTGLNVEKIIFFGDLIKTNLEPKLQAGHVRRPSDVTPWTKRNLQL